MTREFVRLSCASFLLYEARLQLNHRLSMSVSCRAKTVLYQMLQNTVGVYLTLTVGTPPLSSCWVSFADSNENSDKRADHVRKRNTYSLAEERLVSFPQFFHSFFTFSASTCGQFDIYHPTVES